MSPNDYINSFLTEKSSQLKRFVSVPYTIPSESMICSTLRNNRGLIGMNSFEAVMSPSLGLKRNGHPFFKRYWVGDIHREKHRILILVPNEFLTLLRYSSHTFIDGTFKITPHPFFQYVIVRTYDCGTELYVPCAFVLVSGKNE
ncbi:hypothetical protein HZS_5682 [Henneguya salminicola]|nr:hypothetical protein HZS_5682 [Henneguya salminicola]